MKTIEERVIQVIHEECQIPKDKIKSDSHLFDDLNFDSLDSIEVVIALETEFDIEIADEDSDHIFTVPDIVKLVEDLS
jgi:acyl carrier protein|tara:strand:+ start:368 stop:601 length:234 start_codon:yes stop_codon:yes gene_type:complete